MKALLDFHHSDLLESLHLLLEDRLGIECYIPVGSEWWDSGTWQFGASTWGDARLGYQFLTRENVEVESGHPDRRHRCVTLPEAEAMEWDYVVASVPDNYAGYHRFAQQHGAKFVIQVGNTNQPIAWELDPLVLNSSEMPLGGRGVTYHQEFRVPQPSVGRPEIIRSFVNCMDSMPCWPFLLEARSALPEFSFYIHGIDGSHGNVKPTAAVFEAMKGSGWGWHDKITGDGFGHVIHAWAATGRPLIGHRGHYVGKMAEPLWVDGVTCIDLDRHSVAEAAEMVREMSAMPATYRNMCAAIRGVFTALVDYSVEAEQVRALLA